MKVWLVIPALGRFDVSAVAFAGYRWLIDQLAERGITCRATVIANDENITISRQFFPDEIPMASAEGEPLASKVDFGFLLATSQGADFVCFTGSDNLLHPDLFNDLAYGRILAGYSSFVVDARTGRGMTISGGSQGGAPPWVIPAANIGRLDRTRASGLEGEIRRNLVGAPEWFQQSGLLRAGLKTEGDMTPYDKLTILRQGDEVDAWESLSQNFPSWLVDRARELQTAVAA